MNFTTLNSGVLHSTALPSAASLSKSMFGPHQSVSFLALCLGSASLWRFGRLQAHCVTAAAHFCLPWAPHFTTWMPSEALAILSSPHLASTILITTITTTLTQPPTPLAAWFATLLLVATIILIASVVPIRSTFRRPPSINSLSYQRLRSSTSTTASVLVSYDSLVFISSGSALRQNFRRPRVSCSFRVHPIAIANSSQSCCRDMVDHVDTRL